MDDSDIDCFVEDDFMADLEDIPMPSNVSKSKPAKKNDKKHYTVLSVDDIVAEIMANVFQVQELIPVSEPTARFLLGRFKWNPNLLIQEYYEHDDCDEFFTSLQVPNPFICASECTPCDSKECGVCFADFTETATHSLNCGHLFCQLCWNQHLTVKIAEEGISQELICMKPECNIAVTDELVMTVITDEDVLSKYKYSMAKNFVQSNTQIHWCPSPNCNFVVKKSAADALLAYDCQCGEVYCFECGDPAHEVLTCNQLKRFKNQTDAETYEWIAKNAKSCPKCDASIEKNGGCMHMTCRDCRHEFCWTCMGNWNGHSTCNRYEGVANTADTMLARFTHYRDRYVNQIESLKLERLLRESMTELANKLQESTMTANQIQFLRNAVNTLRESRRTLASTYVFAYYLQRNNHVEMFEDNQADLEMAVERLSGYLEHHVKESSISSTRSDVIDRYEYCSKRCTVLMECIAEGKDKKWFTFTN